MSIKKEEIDRIYYYEKKPIPKYPNWYGMKKALHEITNLPRWMPAACHIEHGAVNIFRQGKPNSYILSNPYPIIFLSNKDQYNYCRSYKLKPINKPTFILGSLYPRYRRFKNINKQKTSKGSLVFAGHSTKTISVKSDWNKLIQQFKELPKQYKPLTICIYFIDYLKGVHVPFLEAGFDVVTAGHISDPCFIDNFYNILRQFKYVISTDTGSHLYYAIEMDIPFMIYGMPGTYLSKGNNKDALAKEYKINSFDKFNDIYQLFTPTPEQIEQGIEITEEQRRFVHEKIGTYDALPLEEVREIILQHQKKFYAKELLKSPITLPLKLYREIKAKF